MNQLVNENAFAVSAIIILTVIVYFIYFYFVTSGLPEKYCSSIIERARREMALFLVKKISGFLILGLIPGVLYYLFLNRDFGKFGFSTNHFISNLYNLILLTIVITIILFINQKANRQNSSLQINLSDWNIILFLINTTGWIIYLVGYEFLFRGILLFECYNSFGFWPAIAINIAIYSAIHMVNGKDQTFGALIFGGIACYLTLSSSSLLIPIIMHVSLSLISDYFSISYNKNLSFINQKGFNLPKK